MVHSTLVSITADLPVTYKLHLGSSEGEKKDQGCAQFQAMKLIGPKSDRPHQTPVQFDGLHRFHELFTGNVIHAALERPARKEVSWPMVKLGLG